MEVRLNLCRSILYKQMSIKFSVHEKVNPKDMTAPRKFYPIARSAGEITLKKISQRIAAMSTVNSADVLAVLNLLEQVMIEEVAEGNIIRLGEFGSFSVSISGTGEAKPEEVTAGNVTSASLNFRPGEELSNLMLTLKYEKVTA